jgi:hypothetical protein
MATMLGSSRLYYVRAYIAARDVVSYGDLNYYATHVTKPENRGYVKYSEPGREHSKLLSRLIYNYSALKQVEPLIAPASPGLHSFPFWVSSKFGTILFRDRTFP